MAGVMAESSPPPWYRQPLVWMLIAIPGSAVVAGLFTIWLAVTSNDGLVADDYYWRGKQINRTLARDTAAAELGLDAELQLQPGKEQFSVQLAASAELDLPEVLTLDFLHSTRAGLDQQVILRHLGGGQYLGISPELAPGGWHLQLGTERWRVLGEIFWPVDGEVQHRLSPADGR